MAARASSNTASAGVDTAISFLRWLRRDGPWTLTAIEPDTGRIETRVFTDVEAARAFIPKHAGQRNLYYSVNPTRKALNKKATKADITSARFVHADIDPVGDETPDEAKARALATLKSSGLPEPSAIIDSGNGLHLLWRLKKKVRPALDIEAFNRAVGQALNADGSTWNVDRILRVPGTVNLPDTKKRKKGRKKCRAQLRNTNDRRYGAEQFPRVDAFTRTKTNGSAPLDLPDELPEVDVDALPVSDEVKHLIRNGEGGQFDGDRSRAVFRVACDCVRAGVDDALIVSLLLDQRYAISEHARTQTNPRRCAARQVERAQLSVGEFVTDAHGRAVKDNQHNVRIGVARLGVEARYDEFADRVTITGLEGFGPSLDDAALDRIWLLVDERFNFRPSKDLLRTVVVDDARRAQFHPVQDYLDALEWDGTPRIDTWLTDYAGARDTEFTQAAGALWLIAAVRRVRQPGCKFDEMLILETPTQGTEKSTAFGVLAGNDDWFSDCLPLNAEPKRVIEATRGCWIIEAGELSGMRRADIEGLKGLLSRRVDKARMAYDRLSTEAPRQCVFAGTTNSIEYLKDQSGNRRFWPVRVKRFDIKALKRDRNQLWAEAAFREAQGESIRLDPKFWSVAGDEQARRLTRDPYVDALRRHLGDIDHGKIAATAVWDLLDVKAGQRTPDQSRRLSEAMIALGWRRPNSAGTVVAHGQRITGYVIGKTMPRPLVEVVREQGRDVEVSISSGGWRR